MNAEVERVEKMLADLDAANGVAPKKDDAAVADKKPDAEAEKKPEEPEKKVEDEAVIPPIRKETEDSEIASIIAGAKLPDEPLGDDDEDEDMDDDEDDDEEDHIIGEDDEDEDDDDDGDSPLGNILGGFGVGRGGRGGSGDSGES